MPKKSLDQKVQAKGYCCTHAFIRLLVRPEDTITKLARTAGVCPATIKNNRKAYREGNLPCAKRKTCLRAIWLLPNQVKIEDRIAEENARRIAKEKELILAQNAALTALKLERK